MTGWAGRREQGARAGRGGRWGGVACAAEEIDALCVVLLGKYIRNTPQHPASPPDEGKGGKKKKTTILTSSNFRCDTTSRSRGGK